MEEDNLRICLQKHLPHEQELVNSIKKDDGILYAAFMKSKLWSHDDVITVSFISDREPIRTPIEKIREDSLKYNITIDPLQEKVEKMSVKDAIKLIVRERVQPLIPMKIKWINESQYADIRIDFRPVGSWSLVGTDSRNSKDKNKATMNFGWFDVATVIHEWGHALGMIHEHQNPRGQNIKWDLDALYKWAKKTQGWDKKTVDNNIVNHYKLDQINGSNFDPDSIMLYFFPAKLTTDGNGTHENLILSETDVNWISKIYGKPTPNDFLSTERGTNSGKTIKLIFLIILIILLLISIIFILYKIAR